MESIWMGIAPDAHGTRVLAMSGASETIMKARLLRGPSHPRALATLLEAIALWQGLPVRAALCADGAVNGPETSLYRDAFDDGGGPLYRIDWVRDPARRRRATRDIGGMGAFADLRQLVLFEVAR
jgi:hypothetical protein